MVDILGKRFKNCRYISGMCLFTIYNIQPTKYTKWYLRY